MNSEESQIPLLQADYLNNDTSGDLNDSETDKVLISHFKTEHTEKRQVMVFKQHQPPAINLIPEICDVVFLVGKNKIPVFGVKSVIVSQSRVFYKMLLDNQREKNDSKTLLNDRKARVILPDYQTGVVHKLMQFLHHGTLRLTTQHVVGLFCAAVEFEIPEVRKVCCQYLKRLKHHQLPHVKLDLYSYGCKQGVKYILNALEWTTMNQFAVPRAS